MQKKELVKKIAEKLGTKIVDVDRTLDAFIEVVTDAFNNDERIDLRGFGAFVKKTRKARKGHDFVTGKTIDMEAKDILTFRMSSLFNQEKK